MNNEWKPMDTAPQDGTELLLYQEDAGIQVSWWGLDADTGSNGWYRFDPTHWMPLPEPPKAK